MLFFNKIILVFGFFFSLIFLFKNDKIQVEKKTALFNTKVIRVTLDESGTGLILDDGKSKGPNITTKVGKKDIVTWKLKNNSGITSLDSIVSKNEVNIFSSYPSKNENKGLTGTVGDFPSGTEEEYGIYYTVNGVSYLHDPKIQIH